MKMMTVFPNQIQQGDVLQFGDYTPTVSTTGPHSRVIGTEDGGTFYLPEDSLFKILRARLTAVSLTIPVDKIQVGDVVDFGGIDFKVEYVYPSAQPGYICLSREFEDECLRLPGDAKINVTRFE